MLFHCRVILFAALIFGPCYAAEGLTEKSDKKIKRVLSIDSGGIRGLIALSALVKIEQELQKPIAEIFDLIAGSSTGSIIALGLTVPGQNNRPKYSAKEIAEAYEQFGKMIFKRRFRQKVRSMWGLLRPRYTNEKLKEFLEKFFANAKISEALIPVLLTGYHLDSEEGLEFYSPAARKLPLERDCLMKDVAMASSAAPTYFSPANIIFRWGVMENVVDGAIYAYNPALIAYAQAKQTFGADTTIEVYSIGTGRRVVENKHQLFQKRGKIRWAAPITGHLLNANAEATSAVLDKLLNTPLKTNYFRLNLAHLRSLGDLDDIGQENMKSLTKASKKITASKTLKKIIENLKAGVNNP